MQVLRHFIPSALEGLPPRTARATRRRSLFFSLHCALNRHGRNAQNRRRAEWTGRARAGALSHGITFANILLGAMTEMA